ncbi:hypothetical protein Patl1_36357 [Pistacia atlantica]|nr:hypothetical protein Patl1_36357 [Pistacia atlantica]
MASLGTENTATTHADQRPKTLADFDPSQKQKRNKFAFACSILASMTSILLGYDMGVMSGAAIYIKKDLKISDVKVEVLVGIINLYSLFGAAAAGRTSDWIGRRYTTVLAGAIFFAGALLMGFATNYAFLMVGRFVAGIGGGYVLMIAPVYTSELSPASSRGFLSSFPEMFINGGILLGFVSNYAFSKLPIQLGWRMMLGISAIPSVLVAVGVLAMPESPRWLVMQGRLGDARKVLDKTSNSKDEAALRLADIKEAVGISQECNDDVVQVEKHSRVEGASGIEAVFLYCPRIFEKAEITSDDDKLLATIAVGFTKTIFILVATFLSDRIGRRPLILSSMGVLILSLATLGFSVTVIDHSHVKLPWAVALAMTMAFFSIGMGPIAWVYSSEIFRLKLRAQGASMGVAMNRVVSGVVSMAFLPLYNAITIGGAFFLFTGVAVVSWVFFYTMFPETQGKTLEEMEVLFDNFDRLRDSNRKRRNSQLIGNSNGNSGGPSSVQLRAVSEPGG